jgi:hypothetical protein
MSASRAVLEVAPPCTAFDQHVNIDAARTVPVIADRPVQ